MNRFTTPTLSIRVDGSGLKGCDLYVTLVQGDERLTFTGDDFASVAYDDGGLTAKVLLTQEQTAAFAPRKGVRVQANIIDGNGHRSATEIRMLGVWENLLEEVIAYEGQEYDGGGDPGGGSSTDSGYGVDVAEIDGESRMVFADYNEKEANDG